MKCKNCGLELSMNEKICPQCGQAVSFNGIDGLKENLSESVNKTIGAAKKLANQLNTQINTTLENNREKANQDVQTRINEAQANKSTPKKVSTGDSSQYMSSTELWSWLKKDSRRQHFFTEPENTVSPEEYADKLNAKLIENNVPALVKFREVCWDRSEVKQSVCAISPRSSVVNPLSCLILFNHVGKFSFVEEKTFITPPNLPEVPMSPMTIPADYARKASWLVWGILIVVCGIILLSFKRILPALVLFAVGGVMVYYGVTARTQIKAILNHNAKCAEQEKVWAAAWKNWQDSIFTYSFQEDINGQLSRIYDSVFECIQQLNKEIFDEKENGVEIDNQSMNELEELIARRKDDYR